MVEDDTVVLEYGGYPRRLIEVNRSRWVCCLIGQDAEADVLLVREQGGLSLLAQSGVFLRSLPQCTNALPDDGVLDLEQAAKLPCRQVHLVAVPACSLGVALHIASAAFEVLHLLVDERVEPLRVRT